MINTYKLDNGLRVVMETIPFVRSISFGVWVRNGSRSESPETSGISHFIEHMLFKGTEKRTAKDIADEMDAVGGQINAGTTKEYTCYYTRTLDTHFDVALDVLADMFFHSRFDEAEIAKERSVILEEINMNEDTPDDLIHDLLQSGVWPGDPLGYPVLGAAESIEIFDGAALRDYFNRHYTAGSIVIAVAGNIREPEILNKITEAFARFNQRECPKPACTAVYNPAFKVKEKDIEQVHLCVGFPGIPSDGSRDVYVLHAVNTVFGGGMSSRLYQTIREDHGLAYSVYSYSSGYTDTGLYAVYAAVNPSQAYEVFRLIAEETRRMFTEKITEAQLARVKEQIKSNFIMSLESSSSRMNSIGYMTLMLNKIIDADGIIQGIDAVNMEQFYAMCERVLKLERMSVVWVGRQVESLIPATERALGLPQE